MTIQFYPRSGQILVCDFKDFQAPEMIKIRPVIVVSPRLPYRSEIVTIVPISTSPPRHTLKFVVQLSKNCHPNEDDEKPCWAKCDMIMNIGLWRLNSFKVGRRKWLTPVASKKDLNHVRAGVLHGLGMGHLIPDEMKVI